MELKYRYAVVSFCADLTDATARSMPVAILMIAESNDEVIAVATGAYREHDDPLASAFLKDVPNLLRVHVEDALSEHPDADAEAILCALQHSLRNSVHVSLVSPVLSETIAAKTPETLAGELTTMTLGILTREMANAGLHVVSPPSFERTPSDRRVSRREQNIPPVALWNLPRHSARSPTSANTLA